MLFICAESPNFSDQIDIKIIADEWSYSNRILKQGTVMTLRCFSVNLQYVISIPSIEKAITFATVYTGPLHFTHYVVIHISNRKHFCRVFSL